MTHALVFHCNYVSILYRFRDIVTSLRNFKGHVISDIYGRPAQQMRTLYFRPVSFFFLLFSSPNLSGRRLDVYHTSTHGVALVRI